MDEIVQHTNPYAYIEVAKENSNKRCNTECDGSWWDTTPAEILMLIGLLVYFGFVDVKGSAKELVHWILFFLSASLLLLYCFQVEIMAIIYANLFNF